MLDHPVAPLGGVRVMDFGQAIGYGVPPKPFFWIGAQQTGDGPDRQQRRSRVPRPGVILAG